MKHILFILLIGFSISCKAQTIVNLDSPSGPNQYKKDLNNVRANFVGIWQYTDGTTEFTLHIYKQNMIFAGNYWGQGDTFEDKLIGNYIYKENGVELINISNLFHQNQTPFFAFTKDGISTINYKSGIVDYGVELINYECEPYNKSGQVAMEITNLGTGVPLQASFKVSNPVHYMVLKKPCSVWSAEFSIPTEMVLTKISNTPPPLD